MSNEAVRQGNTAAPAVRTRPIHRTRRLLNIWFRRLYQHQEIRRLRHIPARTPALTHLMGKPFRLVDGSTFLRAYREAFDAQLYRFRATRESPTILDCGAYIGLYTLYWKQLYPQARIIAFEPDPTIFEALSWNCEQWQLSNVEPVNKAVWNADGQMQFWSQGSDTGRLILHHQIEYPSSVTVPTVRLRAYLERPIDLLKLDVEGAEVEILLDCADHLGQVDHVMVMYHSFAEQPQQLDTVLSILREAGFRVYLQPQMLIPCPFITRLNYYGLDQTINLFAYRKGLEASA